MANLDGKYAFDFNSLKAIKTVKKSIYIDEWTKETAYNKGIYKKYKLKTTDEENVICKYYHILEFENNGELWGIYFPYYELPIMEEITGLIAEKPQ